MKKIAISLMILAVVVSGAIAGSKYAADATASGAAVNFKAKDNGYNLTAISAECGASDKEVKVYARKEQAYNPQAVSAYSSTTCTVVNTGVIITNSDLVVYQHIDGTVEYRTVTSATATTIVLSSAITGSFAVGDKIYELGQIGSFNLGVTNTSGAAILVESGQPLVKTPSDSPLRVLCDGGTNNVLTATAN